MLHYDAPRGSSDSFGFVLLKRPRPGGRRVYSGSFVSSGRAPGAFKFIRAHPGGHRYFFGFVSFILELTGGRWVHSCSFRCAPGVVGFIWVRLLHSGALLGSLCSFGLVCFIQAHPRGRRVLSASFRRTPGVVWIIRVRVVHSGAPHGRRVHLGSFASFGRVAEVVGVSLLPLAALRCCSGSFVSVRFIRACHASRRVYSRSFGSFGHAPLEVGFILVRLVHSGVPRES